MITRRFACEVPHCRRQIFAERFGDTLFRSERAEQHGWNASFIIWVWRWAAGQQQALPSG